MVLNIKNSDDSLPTFEVTISKAIYTRVSDDEFLLTDGKSGVAYNFALNGDNVKFNDIIMKELLNN